MEAGELLLAATANEKACWFRREGPSGSSWMSQDDYYISGQNKCGKLQGQSAGIQQHGQCAFIEEDVAGTRFKDKTIDKR